MKQSDHFLFKDLSARKETMISWLEPGGQWIPTCHFCFTKGTLFKALVFHFH